MITNKNLASNILLLLLLLYYCPILHLLWFLQCQILNTLMISEKALNKRQLLHQIGPNYPLKSAIYSQPQAEVGEQQNSQLRTPDLGEQQNRTHGPQVTRTWDTWAWARSYTEDCLHKHYLNKHIYEISKLREMCRYWCEFHMKYVWFIHTMHRLGKRAWYDRYILQLNSWSF